MVKAGMRPLVLALVPLSAPFPPLSANPGGARPEATPQDAGGGPRATTVLGMLLAIVAARLAITIRDPAPAWPVSGEREAPAPDAPPGPPGFLGAHLDYGREREALWGRLTGAEPPPLAPSFAAALAEVPADAFGRTCPGIPHSALGIPDSPPGAVDYPRVDQVRRAHRDILRAKRDAARIQLDSDRQRAEGLPRTGARNLGPAAGDLEWATSRAVAGMYEAALGALDGREPLGTWEQVVDLDRSLRPVFDHFQAVSHEVYVNRIGLRISEIELDVVQNRLAGMAWKTLCLSAEDIRRKADLETAGRVQEADIAAALARHDRMVQVMGDVRAALDALHRILAGPDPRPPREPLPEAWSAGARMPDEETRDR